MNCRSILGIAMLAAGLSPPAGVAQTASPDVIPKFSEAMRDGKPKDPKLEVPENIAEIISLHANTKPAGHFHKQRFIALSAAVYGASLADMHQTLEVRKNSWWYETDPLARPFVNLPAPAYYATGLAMATGINWLSWKMGHSRRWHKLSPIPQLLAIAGNLYGFRTNHF